MDTPDRNIGQYLTDQERERGCSVIYFQTIGSRWRTRDCFINGEPSCPLGAIFPELGEPAPSPYDVVSELVWLGRLPRGDPDARDACHARITAFILAVDKGHFTSADEIYAALGCVGSFHPSSS